MGSYNWATQASARLKESPESTAQRAFLLHLFGDYLTSGKQPNGRPQPMGWCVLRLMDARKVECLWQEAYRRRDSVVVAGVAHLMARSDEGHPFFGPQLFCGNGRQTSWRPGKNPKTGRMQYRDPKWRFSEPNVSWLMTQTLDCDRKFALPDNLALWRESMELFWVRLEALLHQLGVEAYEVVATRWPVDYGFQVHILIEPCDAQANLKLWKRVSYGLQRLFAEFGADPDAAGKATQLFRYPECRRPDKPGVRATWIRSQSGRRAPLDRLAAALEALNCLPDEDEIPDAPPTLVTEGWAVPALTTAGRGDTVLRAGSLMGLIESGQLKRGFQSVPEAPSRNCGVFHLWRGLRTEGWPEDRCDAAVARVNQLSQPGPLDNDELAKTLQSARRYIWPIGRARWGWLCAALGVELPHPGRRMGKAGKVVALRRAPDRYQQMVAMAGQALDRLLSCEPTWRGSMAELLDVTGIPEKGRRALQMAIADRVKAGTLRRESKRGRYGYVQLTLITPAQQNVHCLYTGGGGWSCCGRCWRICCEG